MSRPLALAVAWVGVAIMVAASFYAPAQPELFQDGAACEIAQCGTLEDPERWRTAWWVWGAGVVLLLTAVPFTARPGRVRPLWAALGLVTAPLWLIGFACLAWIASQYTSVQGAATVAVCGLLAPVVDLVAGAWKQRRTSA